MVAALAAGAALVWLAVAVLMPRPPLPDPDRPTLAALWGGALALSVVKLVADHAHLAVGAYASCVLAAALVTVAARRRNGARPDVSAS